MNHVGFCVLDSGDKPLGICPIPESHAIETARRYQTKHPGHVFRIVPVYFGIPLMVDPAPPAEEAAANPQETA